MIEEGYVLKARCIKNSVIASAPPYIREIWDWLVLNANHKDKRYEGFTVKRGQIFCKYSDIREALSWKIGYRKMMYHENHTKRAMKFLREHSMIELTIEPRGNLITIVNYDKYQTSENYERTDERTHERTNGEPMANQTPPPPLTRMKELKNEKRPILQPPVAEESENKIFSYDEKINSMLLSNDPRMPIIAEYWKAKNFAFENQKQYEVALKRELRAAGDLTGYAIEQVKKTLDWLKNNANFKWTLETVGKYINEPLDTLSTSGKPKTEDDWMLELRAKERQYATQQFT